MKLRSLARRVRHLPDRLLHRLRHRRARRILSSTGFARSVLFVCHGNICRSPYAERYWLQLMPARSRARVRVASAGLHWEEGRTSPVQAVTVARRRGIELSGHRSRNVATVAGEPWDIVFAMEPVQARLLRSHGRLEAGHVLALGDLDPGPVARRSIRDPYGAPEATFDRVFARIDRCLSTALGLLIRGHVNPEKDAAGEAASSS